MTTPHRKHQIVAYFPEWEYRRPYYVKDIEKAGSADKITIIQYAFGFPGPDPVTGEITAQFRDIAAAYQHIYTSEMSVDGVGDDPNQPLRGHFNQLKKLKARHPNIRVVISLGGWTDSGFFSDACRTAEAREKIVASCIDRYIFGNLPEANGAGGPGSGVGVFDGIDIDWEYPIRGGLPTNHCHPDDGKNFVLMLQEFRKQFQAIGRPDLLLTMAGPGPGQAAQYNLQDAHPYLDIVSIMSYDMRGAWHSVTGHHTHLYNSSADPAPEAQRVSADTAVKMYRSFGVPAEKLMVGAAFYGKAWQNVPPENNGLYQPGKGLEAKEGEGDHNYYSLKDRLSQGGYQRFWDESAQAPYLYSPSKQIFWTYDDPESVGKKAHYVREHGLGGIMFWEVTGDDAQGTLVDTIYQELEKGE